MKMKLILSYIATFIIVPVFSQVLTPPITNAEAGIYTDPISVELYHPEPGVTIFYTLDGSEPTVADNIYSGPILLGERTEEVDIFTTIPTNPALTYPYGTYSAGRAASRGWVTPFANSYKVNILRYKAFKPGYAPSPTHTKTFMVDPLGTNRFSIPILSIAMDYDDIFSDEEGIYVYGNHPDGNYEQKGRDWERIMSLEFFEKDGTLKLSQDCRTRIHGGGSRHAPKKTFRVYAETGEFTNFKIPFFTDTDQAKFKRILLKAGGHRPDCFPRDDLANMLTEGLNVEKQHFRHVIVFINGEYWGIHSIKERLDQYFIQNLYGIDDNDITLLDQEYDLQGGGNAADSAKLKNLENFIIANDMNDPNNFKYVDHRIDIANYIDYMCAEIFLSNEDWVYSNVNIWKRTGDYNPALGRGHDGKFRWALYDLDGAFGGSCDQAYYTVNTLAAATVEEGVFSSYSRFFRGLLESDKFRFMFINRMSDLTNSWFKSSVMHDKIDSIYNMITPEIYENAVRWRYPAFANTLEERYDEVPSIDRWNELFDLLHIFASRRQRKIREHFMLRWGFADTNKLTVSVNDIEMGRVQVNSILINKNLPGTSAELYPWTGDYIDDVETPLIAVPLPGYRFVEWVGTGITNDTLFWLASGDTTFTALFEPDPSFEPIRINELMLSNDTYLIDNFGEYDDWLELYNPNNYTVNLSGSTLKKDGISWVIPNDFTIPANGYQLFWHDKDLYQGPNHVNFKLNNGVDTVFLCDPNGVEMDQLIYKVTPTDNSFGRYPNGSETFANFTYPTPLQNNNYSSVEEQIVILTDLKAYPNPSSSYVNFNKPVSFQLFDLNGRLIAAYNSTQSIDISPLERGIYFITTTENEKIKIIKN